MSLTSPPDQTFTENENGRSISWTLRSESPDFYEVKRNGNTIDSGGFSDGQILTILLDNLSPGTYQFELTIYNINGHSLSALVLIHGLNEDDNISSSNGAPPLTFPFRFLMISMGVMVFLVRKKSN